jgi:hypothetical protein
MIDLLKIPKALGEAIAGLLDRDARRTSPFIDDLPPVPDGTRDAFMWRVSQGHIRPDVPKRTKLETLGADYWTETKWRDG